MRFFSSLLKGDNFHFIVVHNCKSGSCLSFTLSVQESEKTKKRSEAKSVLISWAYNPCVDSRHASPGCMQ